MNSYEYKPEKRKRVLFLRVAYVTKPKKQPDALPMSMPPLTYRNFYPVLVAGGSDFEFEDVVDTIARMQEWLRAAGKGRHKLPVGELLHVIDILTVLITAYYNMNKVNVFATFNFT